MSKKIVIIGDVAFETTVIGDSSIRSLGGSGFYSAIGSLATNHKNFTLITSVGTDFDFLTLDKLGINREGISVIHNEKTACFTTEFINPNDRIFRSDLGALKSPDFTIIKNHLQSTIIFLSGSNPNMQLKWIKHIKGYNFYGKIAVDLFEDYCEKYPLETKKVIELSDIVFLNEVERKLICNDKIFSNKICILKKGSKGAIYSSPNKTINITPTISCTAVDTNGAGDILAGAFLSMLLSVGSITHALQTAVNIATLSVSKHGVYHILEENDHL